MKKINILVVAFLLLAGFVLGAGYQYFQDNKKSCKKSYAQHVVFMEHNTFVPSVINAKRCDKLTLVNKDAVLHSIAFGEHDDHVPYGDFKQENFLQGERMNLVLFKTGTYKFHDHLHDEMQGLLKIVP